MSSNGLRALTALRGLTGAATPFFSSFFSSFASSFLVTSTPLGLFMSPSVCPRSGAGMTLYERKYRGNDPVSKVR